MDKIKYGETAVLEDNREYTCFGTIEDNGIDYAYLISNFKPLEVRFVKQRLIDGDLQIQFVTDKSLKIYLYNKFQEVYGKHFDK